MTEGIHLLLYDFILIPATTWECPLVECETDLTLMCLVRGAVRSGAYSQSQLPPMTDSIAKLRHTFSFTSHILVQVELTMCWNDVLSFLFNSETLWSYAQFWQDIKTGRCIKLNAAVLNYRHCNVFTYRKVCYSSPSVNTGRGHIVHYMYLSTRWTP